MLVIGLDGVPWDLVSRWAEQGIMPNLARLIREGTAGPLDSTMPPTSGPSWTTFSTGRNPGNTGIYDFLYRRANDYVFPPVNTTMRSGKTLWRMLSERGDRVCVVNLPVSYPVEEVNGVMVSGWMTPYFARDYTWPRELARELDDVVGNYRIYPSETWSAGRSKAFFRASDELLEMLTRSNLHLMEREDWDLFMGVYFDTDRVLHQVYHFLDEGHPWREGREGDWSKPVLRYFSRLDADIGRLVDKAGDKARILVMSDHGMGRASRFVVLNNLLLKLGFIHLSDDIATRFKAFVFRRGFTLRNIHKLVDR
ncbi:MAG: alkaline phosphatase family protein, partial [bacterium]